MLDVEITTGVYDLILRFPTVNPVPRVEIDLFIDLPRFLPKILDSRNKTTTLPFHETTKVCDFNLVTYKDP